MGSSARMSIDPMFHANMEKVAWNLRDRLGAAIAVDAIRYAPRDTNLLASRISYQKARKRVVADTDYAAAVENGSVPHDIPNAWGREGVTVHHPGGPAQPYLRPAAFQWRSKL